MGKPLRAASGSEWPLTADTAAFLVLGSRGCCSQRAEMETEAQRTFANFDGGTDGDSKAGFGERELGPTPGP